MKIPIPFLGWIEEDDCNTNELKQERDFYKDEPKRTDYSTTKNNTPSSYQWQSDELGSMERESSKSPKDVKELKP
jgi:hypothetical protein